MNHSILTLTLIFLGTINALPAQDTTTHRLRVFSYPDSASVIVDDVMQGHTPYVSSEIGYGPHKIRLFRTGYADHLDSVNVAEGKPAIVNARLRIPGVLLVETEPPGATVHLDGELVGLAPLEAVMLAPGRRRITATIPDYKDFEHMVVIPEGDTARVVARMISKYGSLSLHVESEFGEVFVDGVSMGLGPLRNYKIPTGIHTLLVRSSDSVQSAEQKLFIGPGTIVNLKATAGRASPVSFLLPGTAQMRDGSYLEGVGLAVGAVAFGASLAVTTVKFSSDLVDYNEQRSEYMKAQSEPVAARLHESLNAQRSELRGLRNRVFLLAGLFATVMCYNTIDILLNHDRSASFIEVAHLDILVPPPVTRAGPPDVHWLTVSIRL